VKKSGDSEQSMLVRTRKSRIYFNNHLFDYLLKFNFNTFLGIGLLRSVRIVFSLIYNKAFPNREEKSLEDFYINRFGKELYNTFFLKDYTHKVWGKPCSDISAEWGRQRVKGLGIKKIVTHYLTTMFYPRRTKYFSKEVEQSLTEFFLYPKKDPREMWKKASQACIGNGVKLNHYGLEVP